MATMTARHLAKKSMGFGRMLLAWVVTAAIVFPVFWLIVSSLQVERELFSIPPTLIPRHPTLHNYLSILSDPNFLIAGRNSIIVTLASVAVLIVFASPAAYAFARFSFPWKPVLLFVILSSQLLPGMVLVIPYYLMFLKIGLVGTHLSLISINFVFTLPFVIWLLRGFFLAVPKELEEAGVIDGCSRLGVLARITMPLVLPGILVTAVFAFILTWSEFLFALVLTNSNSVTLPVRISGYLGVSSIDFPSLFCAGVLTTLPVLIAALFMQRYLVKGVTAGGLKG